MIDATGTELERALNPAQREAVEHVEGPLLVLAGAGSGKTRVLTARIAQLIDRHGVPPDRILAATFTNKAAGEMKERIGRLLSRDPSGLWIGTFHSLSARLLRREAELLGFTRRFTIYDEDDRLSLVKRLMDQRGHSTKLFPPRAVTALISAAKNRMVPPSELAAGSPFDRLSQVAADVHAAMGPALRTANAMDFDDLLLHPLTLFREHPDRLRGYQDRFRFILVDEFQDTNRAQYELVRLLGAHGNVFAVGDDDQCVPAGTAITMADGRIGPVEAVMPGDQVLSSYGGGELRAARVTRVYRRRIRRELVRIRTLAGLELSSTPEHSHFADVVSQDSPPSPGRRRNLILTLNAERRRSRPMHRIAISGNDAAGRTAVQEIGLRPRGYRRNPDNWRYETVFRDFAQVEELRIKVAERFPTVTVLRKANVLGKALTVRPASTIVPGMVLPTASGRHDPVVSVERVPYDGWVFDLNIEGTHNFIANGIVTHNSIYGWRGADVRNMQEFLRDFPGARLVRLEENYRSTQTVLDAANGVIAENTGRIGKTLVTRRQGGEMITLLAAADERDEAEWVARELERRSAAGDWRFTEMAVLYRTNAQSRALEEAFRRAGVPYRLVGATSFYERREVKDLLAYLRLVANPADDEAFLRAVGVPRRGLGDTSLAALGRAAASWAKPLLETARLADGIQELRPGVRVAFAQFAAFLNGLAERAGRLPPAEVLEQVLRGLDFEAHLHAEGPEGVERWENVRELVASAADWSEEVPTKDADEGTPLERFLAEAALLSSDDTVAGREEGVTLMTLHTAKGLEWPVVVLTGLEQGLFPLARAEEQPDGLEEERRLCYVGLTRAKDKLYLTWARSRRRGGELRPSIASRFLRALPPSLVEERRTTSLWAPDWGASVGGLGNRAPWRQSRAPVATPATEEEASQDSPRYVKGERVRHRRFGSGVIQGLTGTGRDLKVQVRFDDAEVGVKQLLVAYAGLERDLEGA